MSERSESQSVEAGEGCHYPVQGLLRDGTPVTIRPIAPEDAQREQAFVRGLSPQSRYFRFMNALNELSPQLLERFTHPDPRREIVLVALTESADHATGEQIAVARCQRTTVDGTGEFAIVVADEHQGKGLGRMLMLELIRSARARGWPGIEGLVLWNNHRMLDLMRTLGFDVSTPADDPHLRLVSLPLRNGAGEHAHVQ